MTQEHAKELLPIITAFANGENVQTINYKGDWVDAKDLTFISNKEHYRITPKPRKVWVNEYPHGFFSTWPSRMIAEMNASIDRIACHEIELPPIP